MKREFAKAYILVDTMKEGTVQNIAMFNDYEEANRAAMAAMVMRHLQKSINGLFRQGTGIVMAFFIRLQEMWKSRLNIFQLIQSRSCG